MTAGPVSHVVRDSFLLELLSFAGWQLQVRDGEPAKIRARGDDVELEATGASLAEAAGVVFARAMRSSNRGRRPEHD